jgi:hypothetical protein
MNRFAQSCLALALILSATPNWSFAQTLYASGVLNGTTTYGLWTIDTSACSVSPIGSGFGSGINIEGLAAMGSTLYGVPQNGGQIYTIDKASGSASALSNSTGAGVVGTVENAQLASDGSTLWLITAEGSSPFAQVVYTVAVSGSNSGIATKVTTLQHINTYWATAYGTTTPSHVTGPVTGIWFGGLGTQHMEKIATPVTNTTLVNYYGTESHGYNALSCNSNTLWAEATNGNLYTVDPNGYSYSSIDTEICGLPFYNGTALGIYGLAWM